GHPRDAVRTRNGHTVNPKLPALAHWAHWNDDWPSLPRRQGCNHSHYRVRRGTSKSVRCNTGADGVSSGHLSATDRCTLRPGRTGAIRWPGITSQALSPKPRSPTEIRGSRSKITQAATQRE